MRRPHLPRLRRRRWGDAFVVLCLAVGIAGLAFAGGRLTVQRGPESVQEAMALARDGKLPYSETGGAGAGAGGGMPGGGMPGGGMPGGGGMPRGGMPGGAPAAPAG